MGADAFLCLCVYVWDKIMLFFLPPVNSCSHSSLDLHALGSSVHQQTEGLECLSPKIEQRNSVYSVREAPLWHSLNLIFYILHVWVTVSPAHGMLVFPNSVQTEIDELANMLKKKKKKKRSRSASLKKFAEESNMFSFETGLTALRNTAHYKPSLLS